MFNVKHIRIVFFLLLLLKGWWIASPPPTLAIVLPPSQQQAIGALKQMLQWPAPQSTPPPPQRSWQLSATLEQSSTPITWFWKAPPLPPSFPKRVTLHYHTKTGKIVCPNIEPTLALVLRTALTIHPHSRDTAWITLLLTLTSTPTPPPPLDGLLASLISMDF